MILLKHGLARLPGRSALVNNLRFFQYVPLTKVDSSTACSVTYDRGIELAEPERPRAAPSRCKNAIARVTACRASSRVSTSRVFRKKSSRAGTVGPVIPPWIKIPLCPYVGTETYFALLWANVKAGFQQELKT